MTTIAGLEARTMLKFLSVINHVRMLYLEQAD